MKYLCAFCVLLVFGTQYMTATPVQTAAPVQVRPCVQEFVKITKVLLGIEVTDDRLPGGKGVVCVEGGNNCTFTVIVYKPDPTPPPNPTALTSGDLEHFQAVTTSISYTDADISTGVYSLEFSYTWTDGTTVNYLLQNNW